MLFVVGPLVAMMYSLYLLARTIYDPGHLSGLAPRRVLTAFGVQSLLYLLIAVVVIPVNYWRLELVTDRRRFRVVSYGALLGTVFYLPRVVDSAALETNPVLSQFWDSPTATLVSNLGALIFPFSFAYAILRQRLFDVRVIIRRGLQFAMARRFLLALPLMAAGLLAVDLILHANEPLFEVLKSHVASYVAICAVAGLAYGRTRSARPGGS